MTNFSLVNLTADLIDSVCSTTDSWESLINELRKRLAIRISQAKYVATHQAFLLHHHCTLLGLPLITHLLCITCHKIGELVAKFGHSWMKVFATTSKPFVMNTCLLIQAEIQAEETPEM